ncbi:hypothetical protein ATK17_1391 [Branchiibius hedensis]|uniref:Membrane protein YfhO n=1 Tax=Branchiibius hedensis TaxID=672460 RepID=A0A2Y8ZP31_9MICO|nr:hypothetical protein [Branchiibius hedensis]PWJ25276.1 hypothetical protein ATK17_1391 [Branchiibius hedensis]SSA34090.1 hypothetical protein SAMN04489750_1391 [Branchiibius hedensis]
MSAAPGRQRRWIGAGVGLLTAVLVLGPALKPGYLLFYDMVFVPRLGLSERTLGIDGSVPRAVPNDLVVALASHVVPGWVVQHVLLVLVFVGAGAGTAALARTPWGAAAAALAATWNPWVAQRLAIGHWGFLLGYACLPFVAYAAQQLRREPNRNARIRLGVWIVLAALTGSTGAILAALVLLAVLLVPAAARPAWRELRWIVPVFLVANAAWWWPFLTLAPSGDADPAGAQAFMARPDTPLGVWGSLLSGGGIWGQAWWFATRQVFVVAVLTLIVVAACVVALLRRADNRSDPLVRGLVAAAVVGLVIAGASAVPGGEQVVGWVITHVPGGGLIRDAQKFAAMWMLVVALGAGALIEWLIASGRRVGVPKVGVGVVAFAVAMWPVATLPGMAWGGGRTCTVWSSAEPQQCAETAPRWAAVQYPRSFLTMADRLNEAEPGAVAVFPWTLYRKYAWNADRTVLDPWQRLVDRQVLVNDDLPLSDRIVRGESAAAAAISSALADGNVVAALRSQGVRWVLVQTDQPTLDRLPDLGTPIATDGALRLYDLGPVAAVPGTAGWWRWLGLGGLAVAVVGAAAGTVLRVRRSVKCARM